MTVNDRMVAYLRNRYAAEIAAGWEIVTRSHSVCLTRRGESFGWETREIDLPEHLRAVVDADAWHREHQAGRRIDLPLFADREDPSAQGALF